ncbi:Chromosome partition protein Smc [Legionella massiliensis]|uniref:Chromosome partition protein Smc n=1 Tax=Legionella massiliensis TaxID=1034943 RepID=A0A078KRY4_9GAMM|nr:chromosome segregation protein SMC [Legionella massiliensis]CDZ75856.1 Chromosome partition protein Smc [Legionella massiliensis]CEE11594.1 Chromosome partition protein Smc [Legionella massiliensis]
MHLKQLKLAGFKSFVDPTVVPFPSQLVAVVGPNGCGKSNIIDAVRWVMGESSAKNLRGESMTDVIFNGSSHRKAVGQASIELVFDNSLGRLTGQYASYQEISVKRLVTRDGDSAYFLNGSRCRRRDITDIFLGTGAGARGYSIIGQGTISRIIEARPEELRAYLEEAAGISKYKERRRETLSRIEHTRENLARVADIRDELDKQLQRLERQARAAERYKELKAQERLCKSEILALKWHALTQEQQRKQNELQHLLVDYEKHQANATEAYKQSTEVREKLHDDNEAFQQVQANFYQLATEIARLEEGLQQHQREKQRLLADQQQMQADWQDANSQLEQDQETLTLSESALIAIQESLQTLDAEFNLKQQVLQEKQAEQASWNLKTQQIQAALNKAQRETQVEQLRLQHLAERRQQILARLEKIDDELKTVAVEGLNEELTSQKASMFEFKAKVQADEEKNQQLIAATAMVRQQLAETEKLVHQAQDKLHRLNTQQARLLAAQQTALGRESKAANLAQWADKSRLVETISVEKNWQLACEFVLAEGLQAIVLESMDILWPEIHRLEANAAQFITCNQARDNQSAHPRLSDKISGLKPNWVHCLDKIYTASSLEEAIAYLDKLGQDESVITEEGYWLGKGWLKTAGAATQDEISLLERQAELTEIKETLAEAEEELSVLKDKRDELHEHLKDSEQALELAKQELAASRDTSRACEAEVSHKERVLQQSETRKNALSEESEALRFDLEELVCQQESAEQLYTTASQDAKKYESEQSQLAAEKASWDESLHQSRIELDEARSTLHQAQLQADREKLKIQQLKDNVQREQSRLEILNERLETLANRLIELENPDHRLQGCLSEKVMQHSELEEELSLRRDQLNDLTSRLESWDSLVRSEEKFAKTVQEKIQQEQMQEQALAVRATAVLESLAELDGQIDTILSAIPEHVNQLLREQELEELTEKIKRLGAINLAAIEEYDSEFQRKQHLDEQYQDLTEALATLDAAIEKMDKETQQRLRATFDEVNTAFQALFPRLFGGGRAMLELTCDNLLEAGVLVMAQPPGKRNSTIHLLSGGEKAMTAVALVFAIFQLNPSPFCMLDEVDAPLDDVNVGRFCALVKEMSQFVQFLFITHNKVTMELADHLIGVTMREPGVSRVVAVDVEQALAMTEAS